MKNIVDVSVIIPTYNRAQALQRCIDSLIGQTLKNFDVFVCDDGSTDQTRSVVENYKNQLVINWLYCENFGGPARPRNIGMNASESKYIAFLDADDWWHPKKLEISIEELEKGHDFVYHDLIKYDESIDEIDKKELIKTRVLQKPVYEDLLFHGNGITNSSVVVKRELMLKIDGFSENKLLIATEDYEAWLRLSKLNIEFLRLDNALGYYCIGNDNLSSPSKNLIYIKELIKIYFSKSKMLYFSIPSWMNLTIASSHFYDKNYFLTIFHLFCGFLRNPYCTLKRILNR
jgi:glycosyltransferase involved in cell wall biosynthesis